jgi:DNA-binding transcriptional LysR family regulator
MCRKIDKIFNVSMSVFCSKASTRRPFLIVSWASNEPNAHRYTLAVELTALRQFVMICKLGHVTRAARELGMTQSSLSATLKRLEEELGSELVHRSSKGVTPTQAGQELLRHAQEAIRAADAGTRAVRELASLQRGSLRIGGGATAVSYLLPPAISAFRADHPGITFYVREAGSSQVASAVASGDLDLGIVTLPLSKSQASELIVTPLVTDELRLIEPCASQQNAGKKLPQANKESTFRWQDLESIPVVAFEAGSAIRAVIDDAARAAGLSLNVVMELRSIEGIKGMVAAGVGVGFVSRFALGPNQGKVCKGARLKRNLVIVRSNSRLPSYAEKAFEIMLQSASKSRGSVS